MTTVKVNYIKDAHNNEKNYFDTDIPKKLESWTKNTKDMGKYEKQIKIAKNLLKVSLNYVCFLKTTGNLILISITEKILKIGP